MYLSNEFHLEGVTCVHIEDKPHSRAVQRRGGWPWRRPGRPRAAWMRRVLGLPEPETLEFPIVSIDRPGLEEAQWCGSSAGEQRRSLRLMSRDRLHHVLSSGQKPRCLLDVSEIVASGLLALDQNAAGLDTDS